MRDKGNQLLIDVSMPIAAGAVFRPGTPPVEIATKQCYHQSEGEFEIVMLSLPAHTATHVDLVFKERCMAPERMIGPGKLVDVTGVTGDRIQVGDIERQVEPQPGDFVFLRTDWSRFARTDKYHAHPELSPEAVQWLASCRINAVGIDAQGLARDPLHGKYDRLLAEHDVVVIESLANLAAIPKSEFTVYCLPLSIERIDAIPARVLVGIEQAS